MEKRELQAGKIVGALWLLWKLTTLDPYMIQMYVHTFSRLPMILKLNLICSATSFLILVLGLMMEKRAIAGIGCLAVIGFDAWRALRAASTAPGLLRGTLSLRYPFLIEAFCFVLLLFVLFNPEKSKVAIVLATILAVISRFSYALGPVDPRARDHLGMAMLGAALYALAVNATGRYFAGSMSKEQYPYSGRSGYRSSGNGNRSGRAGFGGGSGGFRSGSSGFESGSGGFRSGSGGFGGGSGANSRRGSTSGQEGVWRVSGSSDAKQERIRKLKELRDSGIMTKAEFDQMVDKIMRS